MKILTVIYDLGRGGTQRAAQNFAVGYADLGHDSRVLAVDGLGHRAAELQALGVPVIEGDPALDMSVLGDDWAPAITHIHSHGLRPQTVRAIVEKWPNTRLVEQSVFANPSPWMSNLTVSLQLTPWCQWRYGTRGGDVSRSAVTPNPVTTESFYPDAAAGAGVRERLGIPVDAIVLGRVGQPESNKWHALTVDTFERIAEHQPNTHLLLVGPPQDIRTRAETSVFSDRIHVVASLDGDQHMRAHYSAMDVFLHAAHQGESFGYVLVEAMLCEVPVVTLQTPWADNSQGGVIGDQIGGFVTSTARQFQSSAAMLISDKDLREGLGRAGRERALQRFATNRIARAALAAIDHPRKEFVTADCGTWIERSPLAPILAPLRGAETWRWLASTAIDRTRLHKSPHAHGLLGAN